MEEAYKMVIIIMKLTGNTVLFVFVKKLVLSDTETLGFYKDYYY